MSNINNLEEITMENVKKINLVKMQAETRKKPENMVDACMDQIDNNPIILETMDDTPENRKKAQKWLDEHKNTCKGMSGYYLNTVYAAEYYTADEDGEWIDGSDYDFAEDDRPLWYAVQYDADDTDWGTGSYDKEEALEMCREHGYKRIAVIEEGPDPVCVEVLEVE